MRLSNQEFIKDYQGIAKNESSTSSGIAVLRSTLPSDENDIKEYVFRTSANNISYTSGGVTYDKFKTFAIKIVLGSASTSIVPKVKDMKAVALDF